MRNEGQQLEAGFVDRDPRETICLLSDGAEAEPKAAVADKEGGGGIDPHRVGRETQTWRLRENVRYPPLLLKANGQD